MNLIDAFRIVYSELQPDFFNMNKEIIDILATSVANLATTAYIANKPERPGNMYITLLGSPRSGKTTALRILTAILDSGKIAEIPNGTPEAIAEALEDKKKGYLFWDEAEELLKKAKTYMDIFPNLLNKMYYCDTITMARRTTKSVKIQRGTYYVNVYMTALPEQWAEIEETFSGGFSRRTLTLYTAGEIPLFRETIVEDDSRAMDVMVSIAYTIMALSNVKIKAKVRGLSVLADRVEKEIVEHEKMSMVEEYLYKIALGKAIAESIEVLDYSEATVDKVIERFINNLRRSRYLDDYSTISIDDLDDYSNTTSITTAGSSNSSIILEHTNGNINFIPINLNVFLKRSESVELYDMIQKSAINELMIADRRMYRIISRIQQYAKRKPIMPRREFIREVLKMRNASQYTSVLRYLLDAEYIRTISYKRRSYIVLNPFAKMCANCKKWGECKTSPFDSCDAFDPVFE
ncbi:MAG TPA: hypothetical protein ENK81_02985 [Euryarchaeota archaeon]|nr:hypothetical protein [Euryarchaeota archaeon]